MDAAKKVAANPDDPAAQAELSRAQQGLQKAIQNLVVLTGKDDKSRAELADALKGNVQINVYVNVALSPNVLFEQVSKMRCVKTARTINRS